jgi:hypothetical protein
VLDAMVHSNLYICDQLCIASDNKKYSRFTNCSHQFIDAYDKGLNEKQAALAARKYCGHHILPDSLMNDLENANFS